MARSPGRLAMIGRALASLALTLSVGAAAAGQAAAQCIMANPSFEMPGTGGASFSGWNQFGRVGSTSIAEHGYRAVRLLGPNLGGWDVSGVWQEQSCAPGETWEITGHARHPSIRPLTGPNVAVVNVEWRDGAGALISADSFNVAEATTPVDQYVAFSLVSGPAPAGTAHARLVLGVLQGPGSATPEATYDQVTFNSTTAPTLAQHQWDDFPSGRTLSFAGRTWRVKGPGWYGPGTNYFSHLADRTWVDTSGNLHLTVRNVGGTWSCTEVVTEDALGYGDYILTTVGRLDLIDPQVVLGIFLWEYGSCYSGEYLAWNAFNEIDIEYGRWGNPAAGIGQFVAQPYDYNGNLTRFDAAFGANEVTSHAMRWLHDKVEYRVWRGGPADESPASLIASWTYTGPHIPRPESPRLHLNLWKLDGAPATNQEVVFQGFTFIPVGGASPVSGDTVRGLPAAPYGRLLAPTPNPFNPRTTVRFELDRAGDIGLEVFDLEGRRVRTLAGGTYAAGAHEVEWNGCDDAGRELASGVYLVQLRGSLFAETRQATLLR